MPSFVTKVKDAFHNFHLEQPGVGPGVGGQHGGIGSNEVYTSSSGNRWADNKRVPSAPRGSSSSAKAQGHTPRTSSST